MPFPVIVPDSASTPSVFPTLADSYRDLAENLGSYRRFAAAASVANLETGRWIFSSDLIDDEDERNAYLGHFAYVDTGSQAGAIRRILREGYEGTEGGFRLSRVLTANLATTDSFEVTSPLPVRKVGTTLGLVDAINQGLKRTWTRARISLVGNGTRQINLSAFPSITGPEWVDGLYDWSGLVSSIDAARESSWPYEIRVNGAVITLVTANLYAEDAPFELAAFVPGNRLIHDGTAWGYTDVGLVNDSDMAAVPIEQIRPYAMVMALRYWQRMVAEQKRAKEISPEEAKDQMGVIEAMRPGWVRAANRATWKILPKPRGVPAHGIVGGVARTVNPSWTSDLGVSWP